MMNRLRLFLATLPLLFAGCACWQPQHAQDKACVVLRQVVDCTETAAVTVGPALAGLVQSLVTGGQMDWSKVESIAESLGFKDGGCFLAQLENDFTSQAGAAPGSAMAKHAQSASNALVAWKTKHASLDLKFKVKGADGKASLR